MGIALIMVQVKSPMLFAVGMYLPLETTFAIFVGGMIRGFVDRQAEKRGYNEAQKARVENAGVLTASGLIAGEALMGLVARGRRGLQGLPGAQATRASRSPSRRCRASRASPRWLAIPVMLFLLVYLVRRPLASAGAPTSRPRPRR